MRPFERSSPRSGTDPLDHAPQALSAAHTNAGTGARLTTIPQLDLATRHSLTRYRKNGIRMVRAYVVASGQVSPSLVVVGIFEREVATIMPHSTCTHDQAAHSHAWWEFVQ